MKNINSHKLFILLLIIFGAINLLQAIYTEIHADEAYYALYAKHLSFGYFDHPPMVALLIKFGALFFTSNLSVRFGAVVLQMATLIIVWCIIPSHTENNKRKVFTFFIVSAALVMFSMYGFIASPDAPLLFFTALFLLGYKRFLIKSNVWSIVLVAIAIAGLFYSKYQALLVLGFVVLSNLKLLLNYKFYLSGFIAILFISPHLFWQYQNDFPSFRYHLLDRSSGFQIVNLLDYFPNQLIVFNPLILGAIIYILFKYKPQNQIEKAYYFIIVGFISFFFLSTFRGHAEPHWTVAASIPMIILLVQKTTYNINLQKFIYRFIAPSLIVLFIIRIFIMVSNETTKRLQLAGQENKFRIIEKIAGNAPVVFLGSFQDPSLYQFFTGKLAVPISGLDNRQTQFDIWKFEQQLIGKSVFIACHYDGYSKVYNTKYGIEGFWTNDFQSANRLKISFQHPQLNKWKYGMNINLLIKIHNPSDNKINFNHQLLPIKICAVFFKKENLTLTKTQYIETDSIILPKQIITKRINFIVPKIQSGVYQFGISCNSIFGPALNSDFTKIILDD